MQTTAVNIIGKPFNTIYSYLVCK